MKPVELSDYGMIGDCRTSALISKYGSIDWLCLPDFHSPSYFARLIDQENGGHFTITIENMISASSRYIEDTSILETTITGLDGTIRITDSMPVATSTIQPLREILRKVEVIAGTPIITAIVDARPYYAQERGRFRYRGKLGWMMYDGVMLNLISDFPLEEANDLLHGKQAVDTGVVFWFSLTYDCVHPTTFLPIGDEAEKRLSETINWWRSWSGKCSYHGTWRSQVIRSAITLRMLTFSPSGALLAAATTSLPEKPHGSMNWDYRYCWPRDAAMTLSAFIDCGFYDECYAFFGWLMTAAHTTRPALGNMYDVYGCYQVDEKILSHLTGYQGARPVRIGNKVMHQLQHDVYGEVMLAVEDWLNYYGKPKHPGKKLIEGFGQAVLKRWDEPDNGIWEIRDKRRHYTYSKVMGWSVIDRLLRLHEKGYIDIPYEHYKEQCQRMRDIIETQAFNKERQCYSAVFGEDTVDASLLLMPRSGYISYNDPQMKQTWEAIKQDLEVNGLILRYPPGFANSEPGEGAFVVCNFWAVDYLSQSGKLDEAEERLERLLSLANEVGLYNEAIDTATLQPLGNMPQSFSHAGLINSILTLERIKGKTS